MRDTLRPTLRVNWITAALLIVAVLARPAALSAQTDDATRRATELSEEATQLYESGDRVGAIARFEEAFEHVRDPAFAFNIAYIYDELGRFYQAYRHYQLYLELYPGAPNRGEVEARLGELRSIFERHWAALNVRTSPPGADIQVHIGTRQDAFGTSPVQGWVEPGPIRIDASLEGYETIRRNLTAVAGVRLEVDLALIASSPPVERRWVAPAGWSLVAVGAASAIAGTVFWVLAQSDADDFNRMVDAISPDQAEDEVPSIGRLRALSADARDQARLGNILVGVGAGLLVGGVALLMFVDRQPTDWPTATPRALILPGGFGVGWSGGF